MTVLSALNGGERRLSNSGGVQRGLDPVLQQTGKAELTAKPNITNTGYIIDFSRRVCYNISCIFIVTFQRRERP